MISAGVISVGAFFVILGLITDGLEAMLSKRPVNTTNLKGAAAVIAIGLSIIGAGFIGRYLASGAC